MLNNLTTKAYVALSNAIYSFKKDQKGVTAIEYGLIAVVMAGLVIYAFYSNDGFIGSLKAKFNDLVDKLNTSTPTFNKTSG